METVEGRHYIEAAVSDGAIAAAELVTAAGNPNVKAEAYDLNHFPALREKYKVMSVPCLVVNDSQISFGKKNVRQLLELISAEETTG